MEWSVGKIVLHPVVCSRVVRNGISIRFFFI